MVLIKYDTLETHHLPLICCSSLCTLKNEITTRYKTNQQPVKYVKSVINIILHTVEHVNIGPPKEQRA